MRGSVFAFESFLMAGGWLVFGEGQKLWINGSEVSDGAGERSAPGDSGSEATAKLVLGTLKNIDMHIRLNPVLVAPFLMKSSF